MKMKAKKKPDWKRSNTVHRTAGCQSAAGVLLPERG